MTDENSEKPTIEVRKPILHSVPKAGARSISLEDVRRGKVERFTVPIKDVLGAPDKLIWLVPDMLPRGNVVLLTGEPSAGKTWIAYDLARAVATAGGKWLDRSVPNAEPQKVLILNFDNPTSMLKGRLTQLGFTEDMPITVHTQGMTNPDPKRGETGELLRIPEKIGDLRHIIEHIQPQLIIVDSLRQAHTLDENSSADAARIMDVFKTWRSINGATVVVIHHTSKHAGSSWTTSARGSGEFIASSDVILEVNDGKLAWTKTRTWKLGQTKECEFSIDDTYLEIYENVDDPEDPGEDVLRTIVHSNTAVPGEIELKIMTRIVEELQKHPRIHGIKEIVQLTKYNIALVRAGLAAARRKKLIRRAGNHYGKGFIAIKPDDEK